MGATAFLYLLLSLWVQDATAADLGFTRSDFPREFVFGAGTSAYQYEGAVAEDGRSPSGWDTFTHAGKMPDKSTADVAADGYHKYMDDVKLMSETGLEAYRFSISWSRLIPSTEILITFIRTNRFCFLIYLSFWENFGFADGRGAVNPKGLEYYNNLIDELMNHGIQVHITLHHVDLPQILEDQYGGWLSPKIVEDFTAYADVCFREFGNRVASGLSRKGSGMSDSVGDSVGDGRASPALPIQPEPPPPLSTADGGGLGANGRGCSPPPHRSADLPFGEVLPPPPHRQLSPDPPLPGDLHPALVAVSAATPDLLPSPLSPPDPSSADRDWDFLHPTKWYVRFQDDRETGRRINGSIYSHPSRWMTIRDEDGDILAGRHLNVDEELSIGKRLIIDLFHIEVLECVQAPMDCDEQLDVVDLTENADGPKPPQRVGGRFWILADEDEDDDDPPETTVRPPTTLGVATSTSVPKPLVIFRATTFIRMWSLLTPTEARERLVTASTRWEMVARDIFNRFEWRSCNRIGM
ncbi:hypothetical protein VPH35_053629 [Triticum aestivum]